jgi:AcrR family transcriptional regulator
MQRAAFFQPKLSKSDRARLKLLEAALHVFGRKGPEGATVREIASAAGQNVAAMAYYFGNKKKLYYAVLEGIIREIHHQLAPEMEAMTRLSREPHPDPAEAARLLGRLLSRIYLRLLSRDDAAPIVQLIVREQLGPTAGFEILYEHGFRGLHEGLCFLVGVSLGRDPLAPETMLKTHMLMGQVYFFAMSREAILRRLKWKTLEEPNADLVIQVLNENLRALLPALQTHGRLKSHGGAASGRKASPRKSER